MKYLAPMINKVLLFLGVVFLLSACTKIGQNCSFDDFIGTWKGTGTCSGVEEDASITIFTNSDGTILTRYSGIVLPTTLTQCDISASGTSGFGTNTTNYSVTGKIEDDLLVVTYTRSGVTNKTCTASLTKE
jgi:hypothetical protein